MKINQIYHKERKGFALIAVMWVVAFLAMILSVTLVLVKTEAESTISSEHSFRAWLLAHKGLSYASHPDVKRGDEILSYAPEDVDEGYKVSVKFEAARINLNYVIKTGDKILLRKLFNHWLNDDNQASMLTDAVIDWVDTNDIKSLNGAESEWYRSQGFEGRPYNRGFESLEEVRLVKGFDSVEEAVPEWRDWFTLNSRGPVDIHEAEPELLSVVAGAEIGRAEQFVIDIKGEDELLGTIDDKRHSSLAVALDIVGAEPINEIMVRRFVLRGENIRVESVAHSGIYRKKIKAIIQRRGQIPRILHYKEITLKNE